MGNKGMKLQPRSPGLCPACGEQFTKARARETYCSLHCAVWSKINVRGPDECWLWAGGLVNGYGAGGFAGKRYKASRVVLGERLGYVLQPGIWALHRCDNPPCCNPAHLFPGTPADNMADKTRKGRGRSISPCLKGEAHGRAVLNEAAVLDIWDNRPHCVAMASKYGVDKSTTWKIMHGKLWAHLIKEKRPAT